MSAREGGSTASTTEGAESPAAGVVARLRERLGLVHDHPTGTALVVLGWALVLAWYVSWLTADLGLRSVLFVPALVVVAVLLLGRPTRRAVHVGALSMLAALLLATPLFLNLPFVVGARRYGVSNAPAFVLRASDLVLLAVFALLAAVPAGLARRLARDAGGG